MDWSLIATATGWSALAGLATGLGALPILLIRRLTFLLQDAALGFSAGIMLSAAFFSLIIPGLDQAEAAGASRMESALIMAAALALGAALISLLDRLAPQDGWFPASAGETDGRTRRVWLFVAAIALHNLPEGLAVGVSFGSGDLSRGMATAIGIGLQNMPEGFAVAVSLAALGYKRWQSFAVALATGLVEPVCGFLGILGVSLSLSILPWGLGLAAGAMISVVSSDIIPETQRHGNRRAAAIGLMFGLITMMVLDVTFG